jgi:uncharacterized protein YkwD
MLRKPPLFTKLMLSVGFLVLLASAGAPRISPAQAKSSGDAYGVIEAVNKLRISNGLAPYNTHPILMQIAQAHADYMAATGSITHYGPNGSRPFQRALAAGYPVAGDLSLGGYFSENIVGGYDMSPSGAVSSWQGDAPHINTMLSPNLSDVGAGVAQAGGLTYYVLDAGLASGNPVSYTPAPGETPGVLTPSEFMAPVLTNTPGPDGAVYHEVKYGQSLWSIAIAYDTKIDQIRQLNNLPSDDIYIYPGQKLLIRKVETASPGLPSPIATVTLVTVTPSRTHPLTSTPIGTATPTTLPTRALPASSDRSTTATLVAVVLAALVVSGVLTLVSRRETTIA